MLLRWFHKTIHLAAKPFVGAESLKEYSARGYWIFGGITVAVLILFLIISGYIGGLSSLTPASAQPFIELILKKAGMEGVSKTVPLSLVIIFLYVSFGLIPQARTRVGEILSTFFYHLMNSIITAGEWCIEHRGKSTVLAVILVCVLGWVIKGVVEQSRREALLTTNFNSWLQGTERFVVQDTFTNFNKKKIEDVNEHWQDDLEEILEIRGGYIHPAIFLHKAIALLVPQNKGQSINDLLLSQLNNLDKLVEDCQKECRPVERMAASERRARDLLHILMGKIYNRTADYDAPQRFIKSYDFFDSVALRYYKDENAADRPYLFAVNNGKGTVYAGLFTTMNTHADFKVGFCHSAPQCALKAYDAYDEAAKDAPLCSHEYRRRANNVTDLLSRLGLDYEKIVNKDFKLKERAKMGTKETLANEIEQNIRHMLNCNQEGESNPDFLTIAQAYSTCAVLKGTQTPEGTRLLQAAGTYLRLAYSYEPGNIASWELMSFSSTLKEDGKFVPEFKEAICLPAFSGLASFDIGVLKEAIGEQCGLNMDLLKKAKEEPCGSMTSPRP